MSCDWRFGLFCIILVSVHTAQAEWPGMAGRKTQLQVGGLFHSSNTSIYDRSIQMFEYAINQVNKGRAGAHNELRNIEVIPQVLHQRRASPFEISKKACKLLHNGVTAVFGAYPSRLSMHVDNVVGQFDIPYLSVRLDSESGRYQRKPNSVNVYPSVESLNVAITDLMDYYKYTKPPGVPLFRENMLTEISQLKMNGAPSHNWWQKIFVVVSQERGVLRLEELVKVRGERMVVVDYFRILLDPNLTGILARAILDQIREHFIQHIVLDMTIAEANIFLHHAMLRQMLSNYYHYIITDLNIDFLNTAEFKWAFSNITGLRLVRPDNKQVIRIFNEIRAFEIKHGRQVLTILDTNRTMVTAEDACLYDAVAIFAQAVSDYAAFRSDLPTVPMDCALSYEAWGDGPGLFNKMNEIKIDSLTGNVELENGRRQKFTLEIVEMFFEKGLSKVGSWKSKMLAEEIGNTSLKHVPRLKFLPANPINAQISRNRTLRVTSIAKGSTFISVENNRTARSSGKEIPYLLNMTEEERSQNPHIKHGFKGFCIDLLDAIAAEVGFTYNLKLVPDGKYGAPVTEDGRSRWNGMVGELIEERADVAVAPLTINSARENVIDFTIPFMYIGVGILYKKPEPEKPGLFSFMNPLGVDVWLLIVAATGVVSVFMYLLTRFSPYEWVEPEGCHRDDEEPILENDWSVPNTSWFTVGTLMQQGSDLNPRALSTRLLGGVWFVFSLIIISSYTANLAAFLTIERMVSPIESVEDLATQDIIKYGTLSSGSTMTFFRDSRLPLYKRMWSFMEKHQDQVLVGTSKEGVEKVLQGNYAYFMESAMLEYQVQQSCNLMQVGPRLDSKGYGIGLPRGSLWRDRISMAILNLQEQQKIAVMYNRWWKRAQTCPDKSGSKDKSLGVSNVGGIFVILAVGLFLAVCLAFGEFMYNSYGLKRQQNKHATVSCWELFIEAWRELINALTCGRNMRQRINLTINEAGAEPHSRTNSMDVPVTESIRHATNVTGNALDGSPEKLPLNHNLPRSIFRADFDAKFTPNFAGAPPLSPVMGPIPNNRALGISSLGVLPRRPDLSTPPGDLGRQSPPLIFQKGSRLMRRNPYAVDVCDFYTSNDCSNASSMEEPTRPPKAGRRTKSFIDSTV